LHQGEGRRTEQQDANSRDLHHARAQTCTVQQELRQARRRFEGEVDELAATRVRVEAELLQCQSSLGDV
jgi:hypothetical protein